MTLPSMPDGISPEWLTEVLRREGYLASNSSVVSVTREQVGDGVGMMSEVSRLCVSYDGSVDALPDSFVVKYPSQNKTNREIAMSYNLYEREVRYFAELDPKTTAYSPRPYITELSGDNFVILMEDMSDYRVGDQIIGANLKDTARCMDELAKLHATFWNDVTELDWVPGIAESYHADNMATLIAIGWPNMCEIFGDFIDPEIAAQGDAFIAGIRGLQEKMMVQPITLLHGDFRLENLFFGVTPDHRPMAIIDWQGPLVGMGIVDVALLLGQNTQTGVRQAHERELVSRYVRGLKNAGVVGYDETRAWQDYELAILYNWVYVGVVAGTLDVHNERAFSWMSQMVARQSIASLDLDVFRHLN
ncbi:MAG: phosphotransferase [Pseudomonadales bacterium]|nr:phosphotransferase [Pseudomonadales bacterium]